MVNSVTFPAAIGGDNSTVDDSTSSTTGLDDGGHRYRFVPALSQFVACAQYVLTACQNALAAAVAAASSAANAPGTNATHSTTIAAPPTVGSTVTVTLNEAGKAYGLGQTVMNSVTASPDKQFSGIIQTFNPTTKIMQLLVTYVSPYAGSNNAWTVALSAPVDATLTGRVAALEARNQYLADRLRLEEKGLY